MSRALAPLTWFSELERAPGGGWQGVLSLLLGGAVLGVRVHIDVVRNERRYRNAKMYGWVYVVAASPEEAATKLESARAELERQLEARVRARF